MPEDREASLHARGLLLLRCVVGFVFVMHGGAKLFSYGLAGTVGAFEQMGVPLPAVSAPVVTAVELLCGAALILGAWTRWAGLLLAVDMTVAILLVRLQGGFFAPDGFELELTLLACVLALAATGPGSISVDARRLRPN